MESFPKLRYPIHTKGLSKEEELILLSYDMHWRTKHYLKQEVNSYLPAFYWEDIDANLANLGHYIEKNICGFDMALRFEGYDKDSSQTKEEWSKIVLREL